MRKTSIEIAMPVYNEEEELSAHIMKLHAFCDSSLQNYDWRIVIADNASTDKTAEIGKNLAHDQKRIKYLRFKQKGRGRAVKAVWRESGADICCYMDIDLSTDLSHFHKLIQAIEQGADIAIGSRLLKGSKVVNRTYKREFISRTYNMLISFFFQTKFSDAQCGFKAVSKNTVFALIPVIKDNEWFMDSELLIVGEKAGYTIYEEPVVWKDNPGSTVRVLPTIFGDLKGLLRLFITRPWKCFKKK